MGQNPLELNIPPRTTVHVAGDVPLSEEEVQELQATGSLRKDVTALLRVEGYSCMDCGFATRDHALIVDHQTNHRHTFWQNLRRNFWFLCRNSKQGEPIFDRANPEEG